MDWGGQSVIFHRHHECDETYIRKQKRKPCKSVVGYDANAMYVYGFSELMPTGSPVVRRCINGFRQDVSSDNKTAQAMLLISGYAMLKKHKGWKFEQGTTALNFV